VKYAALAREAGLKPDFQTAAVFNNEGIAYLHNKNGLESAYQAFSKAIECDRTLLIPHRNRVVVYLNQHPSLAPKLREERLREALGDIHVALNSPSAELHYLAGLLHLHAGTTETGFQELEEAVTLGLPTEKLRTAGAVYPALQKHSGFAALLAKSREASEAPRYVTSNGLVDPVGKPE
jgi:hypothetical protein